MLLEALLIGGLATWARRRARRASASEDAAPAPDDTGFGDLDGDIRAADTTLAISVVGLAAGGVAVVAAPLTVVAATCVAVPLADMGVRSWLDTRRKGHLPLVAIETVGAGLAFATGHIILCAAGQVVFYTGHRLMLATRRRNRLDVRDAFGAWVEDVWVVRDGVEVRTPLEALRIGDRIVVVAGQPAPCDGTIVEGAVAVDQRMLTGESVLAEKHVGDALHAATMVLGGRAVVVVERTGRETLTARLVQMLARTASFEQTIDLECDAIADATVSPALAMGAAGFAVGGVPGALAGVWSNCFEAAWLNMPAAALGLTRAAARDGILVKDGRSLELLARIDTVVFDKTGTLTEDTLGIAAIEVVEGVTVERILRVAAAAERRQTHPIAHAIIQAADAAGISHEDAVVEPTAYRMGLGLAVAVDGVAILIGSRRMLTQAGVELPPEESGPADGRGQVWIAFEGRYVGRFEFEPTVRPEARALIEALHARGIEVSILTGDDEGPTRLLAESLGIDTWFARTLPEDKADRISTLQAGGRTVCFVGDGINDTLAMHRAQVSVSLAGASTIAVDSAQIILGDGTLGRLDALFDLAERHAHGTDAILGWTAAVSIGSIGGVLYAGLGPIGTLGAFGIGLAGASVIALRQRSWRAPALPGVPRDDPTA